ncbi:hypothetical protein A3Q56_05643 [Intoshia linei]|uniref:Uncharacterized protein n=1 Tax=Intoshia linei TaxID=1819745 RepID=A0A177AYY8_9BILA|nr:hypothetical protein A3Q56_05643 [Intoshia linei]
MSNQLYYRPESAKLIDGKQNQEEEKPKSNRELLPNFTFPEEDKIESRDKNRHGLAYVVDDNTHYNIITTNNGTFTMEQVLNDNANLRSELYQLKLANDTMRRHIENEDDYTRIISDATIFDGLSRAELTSNYGLYITIIICDIYINCVLHECYSGMIPVGSNSLTQ